jgi:hypothetical protein
MLQTKYVVTQQKIKEILKDRHFAITTDSWTSTGNHGYVTCTAHFVNKDTWTLHSLVLGIFLKDGASTAQDTITYVEIRWPFLSFSTSTWLQRSLTLKQQ